MEPQSKKEVRSPVTLKIKFKSESLDQFIERYAVDVSRGGIFIRTKEPLAVGTQLKFEFQLQDASPLIAGDGTVVWIREHDPARAAVAPGMGVRFDKLSSASHSVLEKILSEKTRRDQSSGLGSSARPSLATAGAARKPAPAAARPMEEGRPTVASPRPPSQPTMATVDEFAENPAATTIAPVSAALLAQSAAGGGRGAGAPKLGGLSNAGARNLAAVTLTGFMRDGQVFTNPSAGPAATTVPPASGSLDEQPPLGDGLQDGSDGGQDDEPKRSLDGLFDDEPISKTAEIAALKPLQESDVGGAAPGRLSVQRAAVIAAAGPGVAAQGPKTEARMPASASSAALQKPAMRKGRKLILGGLAVGGIAAAALFAAQSSMQDVPEPVPAAVARPAPPPPVPTAAPALAKTTPPAPAAAAAAPAAAAASGATAAPAAPKPEPPAVAVPAPNPFPAAPSATLPSPSTPLPRPASSPTAAPSKVAVASKAGPKPSRPARQAPPPTAADDGPERHVLRVTSNPRGADVIIDGRTVGKTPYQGANFDVAAPHALTLKLDGYEPDERMVSGSDDWVKKGKTHTLSVSVRLQKLPGAEVPAP